VLYDAEDGISITLCRIVRRLDVYGRVRFVPLEAVEQSAEEARLAAEQTWVVTSADGSRFWRGSEAVARLGEALPLGGLLRAARLPGVAGLVDWLLSRFVERRARLSAGLELSRLPSSRDERTEPSPATAWLGKMRDRAVFVCVAVVMVAETSQVLVENNVLPGIIVPERRPEWMNSIVVYPRLFQGWAMFSPAPPTDDGHVVVDGRTADGRKFDPLTGREPDFDVQPVAGYKMNQIWGDFHRRIGEPRFDAYWDGFREFLSHHHELTRRPADRLVAFDVWYVTETIAPPGSPANPAQRRKLFSAGFVQ
jgi:predicted DCC family thiol-disulfide oxidoreductase YuxK